MPEQNKAVKITISSCPKCDEPHEYSYTPPAPGQDGEDYLLLTCLKKGEDFQAKIVDPSVPEDIFATHIEPDIRSQYEFAKTLANESVVTARNFSQFMIGVSTGAIPIYLGLLKFVSGDENSHRVLCEGIFALIPT